MRKECKFSHILFKRGMMSVLPCLLQFLSEVSYEVSKVKNQTWEVSYSFCVDYTEVP